MRSLQSDRQASVKDVQVAEKDVTETPSNLRSETLLPTPASSDLAGPSSSYHVNPPLLSLFDNAVVGLLTSDILTYLDVVDEE